jgi:hypothetical protein
MKEIYKKTKLWRNKKIKDILKIYIGYEYDVIIIIKNCHYNKGKKMAIFSLKIEEINEFIKNLKKAKRVAIKNKKAIENEITTNNLKEIYKKTKWKNGEIESEIVIVSICYDIGIVIRIIDYEDKKIYTIPFFYEINEIDEFIENLKKAKEIAIEDKKKESLR